MSAAMDADEGDPGGIELLEALAMPYGYEPVPGAVEDVSVAAYAGEPEVGAQVIPEHISHGQYGDEPFHYFPEIVVRAVQDQVTGIIVRGDLGREAAANAASVQEKAVGRALFQQRVIDELDISQHGCLAPAARAFAEAAVVHQDDVIVQPVKIPCVFRPSLDAAGIAVEIKDQPCGVGTIKMQPVDAYPFGDIEEELLEWDVILVQEIGRQLFRLEDELVLYEIGNDKQDDGAQDNVYEVGQEHLTAI